MCVIYACSTSLPPFDELERGSDTNDDGAGVSWLGKTPKGVPRIFWKKGLKDHKEVLDFIKKQNLTYPLAIHFRTASVGGKLDGLCHPFPLGKGVPLWLEGDAEEVLMHNGHLQDWEKLVMAAGLPAKETFPTGPWSDSRALAWLTHLKGYGILPFVVSGSRVLMMHATPNTGEDEAYDPAEDHFSFFGNWVHKKEGWSQSCDTYVRACTRGRTGYATWEWDRDEELGVYHAKGAPTQTSTELPNIWTIGELQKILTELEGAQSDAKLAAGV